MDEQQEHQVRYVILTQEILEDERINAAEKLILARITGFDEFFESASETGRLLHLSELVVQRAKRKLEKLGFIETIADTGRGKRYRACLWKTQQRYDKKVIADMTKKSYQTLQKSHTENKVRIKDKSFMDETKKEPVENSEYGRADINELEALWEQETGISIKGQQAQRRQLYNLTRKYGLDKTKRIIEQVGKAAKSTDRYAPLISTPSDLTGKFEKLSKLILWHNRNLASRPFGNNQPTPAPKMATASLKTALPDYGGAFEVQSDEERAKVSEMIRQTRQKLKK